MANGNERTDLGNDTVLVAYATVHLESGERFELLPFEDTHDVKTKVCELMKAWAQSGFLIRGGEIYPWHRVRRIEATRVEEMSRDDAKLEREEWQARETARMQQSFWKTKRVGEQREEGEEGNGEGKEKNGEGRRAGMAA